MATIHKPLKKSFESGEVIIAEGAHDTLAYLVLDGQVEISKIINGNKIVLAKAGKNEILGEMSFFDNKLRSATVVAIETTTVLSFPKDLLDQELSKVQPWLSSFLKVLVDRTRSANFRINPMSGIDYLISSLMLLYYFFKAEGRQADNLYHLGSKKIRSLLLDILHEDQELLQALEKQLMVGRMINASVQDGENIFSLAEPSILKRSAELLKLFRRNEPGYQPLDLVLSRKEQLKDEVAFLETFSGGYKSAVSETQKMPLSKLVVGGGYPKNIEEIILRLSETFPISLKQDGENKSINYIPSELEKWLKNKREERAILEFIEKILAHGIDL